LVLALGFSPVQFNGKQGGSGISDASHTCAAPATVGGRSVCCPTSASARALLPLDVLASGKAAWVAPPSPDTGQQRAWSGV